MAKIIAIGSKLVVIGMDGGEYVEIPASELEFEPRLNDEVEIYNSEARTIVVKKEWNVNPISYNEPGYTNGNPVSGNDGRGYRSVMSEGRSVQQYGGRAGMPPTGKKAVNKVTYCALSLLLGWMGAHKFYTGKVGLGVAYLIFCGSGIPAIIALVEFAMALCQSPDENGNIYV